MKRSLAFALAFALVFTLTACKDPTAESSPPVSSQPSETLSPSPSPSAELSTDPEPLTRDNFPRLDGSTSTAPLGRAVVAALLGETEEEVSDLIFFSRTTNSFRALMAGEADLLIVGEPNASVYEEMEEAGFEASIDTFATDGLIFVVNEDNPVDSLTTEQIQAIYSGEITNWSEVGGDDMPITPFQRNEDAGSQALMKKLVMKDTELMDAPSGYIVDSMMGLMEAVRSYDNSPGAIGYSVYYYANDMKMASGLKILAVDGVTPSAETIRSEEYPHRNAYYVVMAADTPEDSPTARVYNWILSEEGQKLVDGQGYVSVLDVSSQPGESPVTTIANRISEDPLPEFTPSDGYDAILPYIGGEQSVAYYEGDPYTPNFLYGLCTTDGTILTDPVYNSVSQASWYDNGFSLSHDLPIWVLTQTAEDENGDYYTSVGLAALDGSWFTGMIYESSLSATIFTSANGVLMKLDDETAVMIGLGGQEMFRWTVDDFLPADSNYRSWFFNDGLNWLLRNVGERIYYRPSDMNLDGPEYQWIDPITGQFLDEQEIDEPMDFAATGAKYFDGGWCKRSGTTITIHYDDGTEKTFEIQKGVAEHFEVTAEYFTFYGERSSGVDSFICDHDGNIILTADNDTSVRLAQDRATGIHYLCRYTSSYDEVTGSYHCEYTYLNPDGSKLLTFDTQLGWHTISHGLVSVVDDTSYRLIDLNDNGRALLCLPRWAGMDQPAE